MSDEEIYAAHGRVLAELKTARTKLAALKAALDHDARGFEEAARLLREFVGDPQANRQRMPWAAKDAARKTPKPEDVAARLDELAEQAKLVTELERRSTEF